MGDRVARRTLDDADCSGAGRTARCGPYHLASHPNYLVVIGEIAALPLAFGLWRFALVFSALNLAVLAIRVREENRALASLRD